MVAPFKYPGNEIVGFVTFLQYINTELTGGMFGPAMLIVIGFVSFLATKAYSTDRALGFSAFLTVISAVLLRFMSLINDNILFMTVVLFIIAMIYLIKERNVEAFGV